MTYLPITHRPIIIAAPAPAVSAPVVVSATQQIGALELSRTTIHNPAGDPAGGVSVIKSEDIMTTDLTNGIIAGAAPAPTSSRKPFNHLAGYRASKKNPLTGIHNVIYEAEAQGIDAWGNRYAVVCEGHKTIGGAPSMPKARELMKDATEFCLDCRELKYGEEGGRISSDRSEL